MRGSLIGTQEDGKSPLGNGDNGVDMFASSGNTLGGTTPEPVWRFAGLDVFSGDHEVGDVALPNGDILVFG